MPLRVERPLAGGGWTVADAVIVERIWPYIERSLDRLVTLALELTEAERLARPPVEGANSIATLVGHTLANAEENLLGTLIGNYIRYDRQADFDSPLAGAVAIEARWGELRPRIERALEGLDNDAVLARRAHSRRGEVTGLDVLVVVARHAAEHLAQAELTRDWLRSG